MKFRKIFTMELTAQLRSVSTWLILAVMVFFALEPAAEDYVSSALEGEHFLNAPFIVAVVAGMGSLFWMLIAAVIAGHAGARDAEAGIDPLIHTAPLGKTEYLGGRFLAALLINAGLFLAMMLGFLLTVHVRGLSPEVLGPFRPEAYVTAYLYIALPNAFIATAIQFSFATLSRKSIAAYFGSMSLFAVPFILPSALKLVWDLELEQYLDPLAFMTVLGGELTSGWSAGELNTRLISLDGTFLVNRLLWMGIAMGVLVFTRFRFRFAHPATHTFWRRIFRTRDLRTPSTSDTGTGSETAVEIPQVPRSFGIGTRIRQTLAIAGHAYRGALRSYGGLIPVAVLLLLILGVGQLSHFYVAMFPRTEHVIYFILDAFNEPPFVLFIPLFISFYAGEMLWREREANLATIADSAPVPDWSGFLGTFLGLALLIVTWMGLLMTAGIAGQLGSGYFDLEIGLYLKAFMGLQLVDYLLFGLLALVIHVVVNQKYVGHMAVFLSYVFTLGLAYAWGIEHNLLVYGADPGWHYTDLRGFGSSVGPWLWFNLYWAAWGLLLGVLASLFRVRGEETGWVGRLQMIPRRFTDATAGLSAVAVCLILMIGGFIFYNTNVLNEYRSSTDWTDRAVDYERQYGRYEGIPQPRVTKSDLEVDIYPDRREGFVRGTYLLENHTAAAIDSIHLATAYSVETGGISLDRPYTVQSADSNLHHRIYLLEEPLQPGDTMQLRFMVRYKPEGFTNSGADASVVANGSYFTNEDWLPAIGYQSGREINDKGLRREYGLESRPRIPSLYEVDAREDRSPAPRMQFEAVVGTSMDQIAVAPGVLRETWTENGRRYFHYVTDEPIGDEYTFFSADYAVHEAQWNDVTIQIYHHPRHDRNLDRMVQSVQASLDYFTEHFEPYDYPYIRVVERHGHGLSLHAEASMIDYHEGYSLLNPSGDEPFDLMYAVMSHEVAHQVGAGYAFAEGAGLMTESQAWYGAIMVVKETYGRDHMRRLLRWMRYPYPHVPVHASVPLLRAADSPWLSYRKGPFAMYALSEYMGEERVNGALRTLYEKHDAQSLPAPTSLDLYRELRAITPDSLQYLLHDLFEANTFWELKATGATAEQTEEGTWRVTLDVKSRKMVVDTAGVESDVPMDDWIEIGIFGSVDGDEPLANPLYVGKHRIPSGTHSITVTVPHEPARAGIDPYHLLDWEAPPDEDNVTEVDPEE